MTLSFTAFVNDTIVVSSDVRDVISDVENFVNVGIGLTEKQGTPFIRTEHIYKPDFSGSPAPRTRAVTAETHFRFEGNDRIDRVNFHPDYELNRFVPIKGMYATIKVPKGGSDAKLRASVYANCYVYEAGGDAQSGDKEDEDFKIGQISLFVGGSVEKGTTRNVYVGQASGDDYIAGRKNHSWAVQLESKLTQGIINIGFRFKIEQQAAAKPNTNARAKHIFIRERTFVVDLWVR